ncbi:MAG: hypothetical protein ACREID_01715 [Planctomycetota bacterium]
MGTMFGRGRAAPWAAIVRPFVALLLCQSFAAGGAAEPRHVIALFDGPATEAVFDFEDPVHQTLEMPLNHLGMVVARHDIRAGPPPAERLQDARAVLTYFDSDNAAPAWLWPWLEEEVAPRGLRVIHLVDFGCLARSEGRGHDPARLARWLARFGLRHDERHVEGPLGIEVSVAPGRVCDLESKPHFRAIHRGPENLAESNRVWVTTRVSGETGSPRTAVVTGAWGGIALDPWPFEKGHEDGERRWYLDPFAFFREALGLEGVPAPHPSVLNGRRMFFVQVDGDGFESLSNVAPGATCARVFLDDVLRRYALPFTVSVIVRSLTHDLLVKEPTPEMLLAREVLNLDHVEPASHGVLHPLRWDLDPRTAADPRAAVWYPAIANYEYGAVAEVRDSIRFIDERLLLGGRRCEGMLWTGSANAPEEAVLECARRGCWNLNGGVFRYDPLWDSLAYVTPWSRRIGAALQVYAGAANENTFDGFFTTMPGAFRHVDTTIERCGAGRILKPADLYLHFYSAEKPARLASVHRLLRRWGLEENTAPVFASVYARAVVSAVEGARVLRTDGGWELRGFGDCRTARLDGEPRDVDFARSRGLLGARRIGGSLYLHLAAEDADVALADAPPRHPHVEQANHVLAEVAIGPRGVKATCRAHSRREIVFSGFAPYAEVVVTLDDRARTARADQLGRVEVVLENPGATRVEARLP